MTYLEIERKLRGAGIAEAAEEAAVLVTALAGIPACELPFRRNENLDSPRLEEALSRRLRREPLQYILGGWEFRGLYFSLNADCLCPRPDTECLVEHAVARLPHGAVFCDIGTGSGAVAVSVLHARPDLRAVAVDISEGALACARQNAAHNGVGDRCVFRKCDALDPSALAALGTFDAVVSNPPYIRTGEIASLAPELSYEPYRALDGGEDGLVFYRAILSSPILKRGGQVLFEIGFDQGDDLRRLAASHGKTCEIKKDLAGNDRVAILQ